VQAGEPENKDEYQEYPFDGVKIYVARSFKGQQLKIKKGLLGGLAVQAS